MTLFPSQDGKALPSSQPACLPSQVTFHSPFLLGTPTIGILILSDGISTVMPVCRYSSRGVSPRSVTTFGWKPVEGRRLEVDLLQLALADATCCSPGSVTSPSLFRSESTAAVLFTVFVPSLTFR